jgi:hypothetical protein
MFCSLDLNRKNINRAISDNMLKDLGMLIKYWILPQLIRAGMNTNDFNYGQTVSAVHDSWIKSILIFD